MAEAGAGGERVVALEAHEVPAYPPVTFATGAAVSVGRRDADWPAFVFVTAPGGSGWVPSRHLSAAEGDAVVLERYDTTELPTRRGELLEVVARDDESGWLWCRSEDGREGWVPSRTLGAAPSPDGR